MRSKKIKDAIKQFDDRYLNSTVQSLKRKLIVYWTHLCAPGVFDKLFIQENSMVAFSTVKMVDLIKAQFYRDSFQAFDTIVRLLAVENYYGINNYGMNLYIKMQQKRGSYEDHNEASFRQLIQSWDKNGYDDSYRIEVDRKMVLYDGSHRLALAIYHGVENISVKAIFSDIGCRNYGIDWFAQNGFTEEEIDIINRRFSLLITEIQ